MNGPMKSQRQIPQFWKNLGSDHVSMEMVSQRWSSCPVWTCLDMFTPQHLEVSLWGNGECTDVGSSVSALNRDRFSWLFQGIVHCEHLSGGFERWTGEFRGTRWTLLQILLHKCCSRQPSIFYGATLILKSKNLLLGNFRTFNLNMQNLLRVFVMSNIQFAWNVTIFRHPNSTT